MGVQGDRNGHAGHPLAGRGPKGRASPAQILSGMREGLAPTTTASSERLTDPLAVVDAFLAHLANSDLRAALDLVADDIVYVNVGLPALRGRRAVERFLKPLSGRGMGFEVYIHASSADGAVVLTERTDVLLFGRLRAQFWVVGRFDVHDGKITLWRDAFDYIDVTKAFLRGLLGIFVPSLRPAPPRNTSDPPGR